MDYSNSFEKLTLPVFEAALSDVMSSWKEDGPDAEFSQRDLFENTTLIKIESESEVWKGTLIGMLHILEHLLENMADIPPTMHLTALFNSAFATGWHARGAVEEQAKLNAIGSASDINAAE